MSERIVSDPSQHGWVDLGDGKWGWAGEGSGNFNGTVGSPLIVDGTENADYNKARVNAKTKSRIDQQFNLTFEARQLNSTGYDWVQLREPAIYVEDVNADEVLDTTPPNLGSNAHPFGNAHFAGWIRADDYLDKDFKPIMQTLTQAEYDGLTPHANTVYFIV